MTALGLFLWILLAVGVQVGVGMTLALWRHWQALQQLPRTPPSPTLRRFVVTRKEREDPAGCVCSYYLRPTDGQALPPYRPGQFLAVQVALPSPTGTSLTPLTRCYSLSEAPQPDHYRISVKRLSGNGSTPAGRVSNFLHDHVAVGTELLVRSPAGSFYLGDDPGPIVLVAAGIGITPLLSMLQSAVSTRPSREVWLFYGARNSQELAFGPTVRALAQEHPAVHVHLCFSHPLPGDQLGRDYQHAGRIDLPLLRQTLPLQPFHFYVCGPGPLMASLVPALKAWGVDDAHLHHEAFGPSSVSPPSPAATPPPTPPRELAVTFARTGKRLAWAPQDGSLLSLAEAHGVPVDSSCRAGSCGTCETRIQSGTVHYTQAPTFTPQPGCCLLCVCTPASALTLDA